MTTSLFDFRNTNSLWCSILVETLVRRGVVRAVISPGSRSTPLTVALARHPGVEALSILDERSASFFALGWAKQTRSPVVLLCTSGTAGANYFPAVIEAHESHVPLIIITADRPPEMRECASGQTIDQLRLYGNHVSWFHELAVPEASISLLRYLRQTIGHAVDRASAVGGGPVHLNAPFRDPLPPIENASAKGLERLLEKDFFDHLQPAIDPIDSSVIWQRPTTARGLIVAGPDIANNPSAYARNVEKLSRDLGWPVLADALSPVRHYTPEGTFTVAAYDAILRSAAVARDLIPRTVLCLGGWPTSKVLRAWLESSGCEIALVSSQVENRDALHGKTRQILARVEQLAAPAQSKVDETYAKLWQHYENVAQEALARELALDDWNEPRVSREIAAHLPASTPLFVASSMPVRDLEYFWPVNQQGVQLYFNRGANGIDGTLSTALGIAHGNTPAILLTGDLALLHDTNGFLQRSLLRGGLTIVLVNNNGGGIFQHLPIAEFDPPFEKYFATPQNMDFAKLCAAYDVEHVVMGNWLQFQRSLQTLPPSGIRVLEIRTDRKKDAAFRKSLFARVAALVENISPRGR